MAVNPELAKKLDELVDGFEEVCKEAQTVFKSLSVIEEAEEQKEAGNVGREEYDKQRETSEARDENGNDVRAAEGDQDGSEEYSDESRV